MGQLLNDYAANDEVVADLPERTYGKSEDVQILIENALRRCRPLTVKELVKFAGRERGSLVRQLHMMLAEKRIVLMIESHREGHERLLVTHPDTVSFKQGEDPETVFAEESKQVKARAARIAQLEEELQRLKAGATLPPNSRPSMRVAGFRSVPPPPPESTPTVVRRRPAKRARAS
jgi:hypothetical protein